MKLKKLTLKNFKGLRDFTLEPNGNNITVWGDNATGKTSLVDSVLFLLFGKDSEGASDFNIKTLDSTGKALNHLDHSVEGTFTLPEGDVTLKKTYKEKWTRKRGQATEEFTGHETIYEIDGVPKTQTDFKKFIESIAPEKLFRLLTSPTFFSEQLKWQDRRQILLEVVGDISDQDVINSNTELAQLAGIIGTRSVDDAKKVENATRKKINDKLQSIPSRIDEATRAMPQTDTGSMPNLVALQARETKIDNELNELKAKKLIAMQGGLISQKKVEVGNIEAAIIELKNKHNRAAAEYGKEEREAYQRELAALNNVSTEIVTLLSKIQPIQAKIDMLVLANKAIVDTWQAEQSNVFIADGTCKTCGQNYPAHMIESQEADFNRTRAEAIERITKEGNSNKEAIISGKAEIELLSAKVDELKKEEISLKESSEALRKKIARITEPPSVEELPEYKELDSQRRELMKEMDSLRAGSNEEITVIDNEIAKIQGELATVKNIIAQVNQVTIQKQRIEELGAREKELVKQYEQSEKTLYMLDLFVKTKVSMLEGSINSKFAPVNFKLFEEQINGGLSETCICTMGGVPYSDLNNGGRIQAGVIIRNILSKHYGMQTFCVVDNAESVTRIPETEGQLIKLVVSENDKALRVELN